MIPSRLNKGDTIGVCALCNPIIDDNIEELDRAIKIMTEKGFKIKLGKNIYSNTLGYAATPQEKAEDLNSMFLNPEIKAVWSAKGGFDSLPILDYLDFDMIKNNPKIFIGYSDTDTITNTIAEKTGLLTFWGTNFKTIATDETTFSIENTLNKLMNNYLELATPNEYRVIKPGKCEGKIVGCNISILEQLTCGKYHIDFSDKILCLEDFGLESPPALVAQSLYYMKQNGVFDKIAGLWIGSYIHESDTKLEKIVLDVIGNEYNFPIIQSDSFGHIERKITIPIGANARIDTEELDKIKLLQDVVI